MPFRWNPREQLGSAVFAAKWLLLALPLGAAVGSAVALFLWLLDWATITRWQKPWLLWLLPIAGLAVGGLYHWLGKSVEAGNNLIVDQIHQPGGGVPIRMAPLVLLGTVVTHLFGGSAGREGTAVQMGGSIASFLGQRLGLKSEDVRILLMVGVAAGFGAVFGTPLTGAIFALEVLALGRLSYEALVPCLMGSIVGDYVTSAWMITHTHYRIAPFAELDLLAAAPTLSWLLLGKVALAGVAFGLASLVFAELTHSVSRGFKWLIPWPALRPAAGGLIVVLLVLLLGTRDYLGLGVVAETGSTGVSIVSSFEPGGAGTWSWWWKTLFTSITVGSGFKGGEVTPLFFIGATLGNTMAWLLDAPVGLMAGLGFVAVFAGATNTPLACIVMGIELFAGGEGSLVRSGLVVYLATACCLAYLFSGHTGIYLAQRIGTPKLLSAGMTDQSLGHARLSQPSIVELLWQRWKR